MAMKIDTQLIRNAASTISGQNQQLLETLNASKKTVDSLSSVWTGQAATATIEAYSAFAQKYFQVYHDMLDEYVKFLNNVAGTGYESAETKVASKADEI